MEITVKVWIVRTKDQNSTCIIIIKWQNSCNCRKSSATNAHNGRMFRNTAKYTQPPVASSWSDKWTINSHSSRINSILLSPSLRISLTQFIVANNYYRCYFDNEFVCWNSLHISEYLFCTFLMVGIPSLHWKRCEKIFKRLIKVWWQGQSEMMRTQNVTDTTESSLNLQFPVKSSGICVCLFAYGLCQLEKVEVYRFVKKMYN